jgi:hypothetical protein
MQSRRALCIRFIFDNASSHYFLSRAEVEALNPHHHCQPPSLDRSTPTLHCYKNVILISATLSTTQPKSPFYLLPSQSHMPSELQPPSLFPLVFAQEGRRWDEALLEDEMEATSSSWLYGKKHDTTRWCGDVDRRRNGTRKQKGGRRRWCEFYWAEKIKKTHVIDSATTNKWWRFKATIIWFNFLKHMQVLSSFVPLIV